MVCPHCGSTSAVPGRSCAACGQSAPALTATTDTLTPPPGDTEAETRLDTGGASSTRAAGGTLTAGAPFGPRYRILRLLGAGGMGVVYQAWDQELGLAVALKTIKPDIIADPFSAAEIERRFKRELLLARQVTHRNVVRIHDIGEVDGVKYLTMPFIEGRTLSSLLTQSGSLPVTRVLQIVREITEGLAAAHAAGVVHRDLKPDNVMIDEDGHAIIMDFGISRSMSGSGAGTVMGAVVGTLEYMSTEQASGQPADHRSDIYSLGLIMYDMVIGRRRLSSGTSPLSEAMARMQHAPTPLRALDPSIPEPLESLVSRCVDPDPARRPQDTAALLRELDAMDAGGQLRQLPRAASRMPLMLAAATIALLLAAVGWFAYTRRPPSAPAAQQPVSVLIADFDNKTGDPVFEGSLEQALGIGIEEAAFITSFARRDALRVATQMGTGQKLDENAARLVSQREGIGIVLAGTVESSGSGYRVAVRAIDPVPGTERYRATEEASGKGEVLAAVGTLAARVREALGDTTNESAAVTARETFTAASLEAAHDYSEAQALANGNRDEQAIELYRRALEKDPNLGRAYSGWATSALKLGRRDEAEELYKKAFALLERMTEREKYRTLGGYYVTVAGNHEKAIENFTALVEKYPADGAAHNNLAVAYFNILNFKEALAQGRKVVEIYPRSVLYRYNYALYAMYAGDFETAEREAGEAIKLNPETPKAYLALAMAALARGDAAAARSAYEQARSAGPRGISLATIGLADIALFEGKTREAAGILDDGIAQDQKAGNLVGVSTKTIALAEAEATAGAMGRALAHAEAALKLSRTPAIVVPAARILIDAGRSRDASALAAELGKQTQPRSAAYGKLIEAQVLLAAGNARQAEATLKEAMKIADLWPIRLAIGAAYIQQQRYAEAVSEIDASGGTRRGEATAVFLDDVPSFRYTVSVNYWQARVHEGLGAPSEARKRYDAFLSHFPADSRAPLVIDARSRRAKLN